VLQHPSGCATINGHGKGWGWFGTLMIMLGFPFLLLFSSYYECHSFGDTLSFEEAVMLI
jgi:hypothetical protein